MRSSQDTESAKKPKCLKDFRTALPTSMKAQLLRKIGTIEHEPLVYDVVPDPVPGPEDILIRIKACGVCHSNLHMIEGDWVEIGCPSKLPIIPGHEISGIVENVGRDVKTWQAGQRVGVGTFVQSCGMCEYCLTGNEQHCSSAKFTGETVDGGFAELIVVPWNYVYALPYNLGFEEAAPLLCPGVTAYRAVKRAGIGTGDRVAVFGVGGVGHMSIQFARLAGGDVTAVDVFKEKLDLALQLGAENAVVPNKFEELGKFDVVMVHTPSQAAVEQGIKAVKKGGTMLLAVFGNVKVDYNQEYTIRTSVIGSRIDMLNVLELASKGKVKSIWKSYSLKAANEVLLELKKGEISGKAVLVP